MDEMTALRQALREQWEWNHSEHCQRDFPHDGNCHWPLPVVLGGDPAIYRTYDESLSTFEPVVSEGPIEIVHGQIQSDFKRSKETRLRIRQMLSEF